MQSKWFAFRGKTSPADASAPGQPLPRGLAIFWSSCFLLIGTPLHAADDFAKGVDLSILKTAEDHGVAYKSNGKVDDAIAIFKSNGVNCVRLRLFVNPDGTKGQVNTLAYTLALAKRVKQAQMKLCLDFHYSDKWADPGHQVIPTDWKNLPHDQLLQKVHDYTTATLKAFDEQHCLPDMVAVGNEITNGMMWPAGGPMHGEATWPPLIDLLKAGISGVRQCNSQIKIMIHIDRGGIRGVSDDFFSHCDKAELDFDVIGLSYYPPEHGTLEQLADNLATLSSRYNKDICIAETAWRMRGRQGELPFPATPDGQKQFLDKLMQVVADTPGHHGKGVFYWEPDWIESEKWNGSKSSSVEARALFDADGNALPGIESFKFEPK